MPWACGVVLPNPIHYAAAWPPTLLSSPDREQISSMILTRIYEGPSSDEKKEHQLLVLWGGCKRLGHRLEWYAIHLFWEKLSEKSLENYVDFSSPKTDSSEVQENIPGGPPSTFDEWEEDAEIDDIVYKPRPLARDVAPDHVSAHCVSQGSPYARAKFPSFGPQYGIPDEPHLVTLRAEFSNPYEDMFRLADADIDCGYAESRKPPRVVSIACPTR